MEELNVYGGHTQFPSRCESAHWYVATMACLCTTIYLLVPLFPLLPHKIPQSTLGSIQISKAWNVADHDTHKRLT